MCYTTIYLIIVMLYYYFFSCLYSNLYSLCEMVATSPISIECLKEFLIEGIKPINKK